jgi:hypothetical protein
MPAFSSFLQPHPAGGRRQADLFGQRHLGDAAVTLDGFEDAQVDGVEFHAGLTHKSCQRV